MQQNDKNETVTIKQRSSNKKQKKNNDEFAVTKRKKEKQDNENVNNSKDEQVNAQQPTIKHNNIAHQQKEPPSTVNDITKIPDENEQKQSIDVASLQNSNDYKIYPVAYKELNTNDDDRSLHVGGFDLNKDKVKTLFKKAGRLFSNKKNQDKDGKLQVANFEIDTKQL